MRVSPATQQPTTLRIVSPPTSEPTAVSKVPQSIQRDLVAIEGDAYGASVQLVYQRDDLAEACSDENNRALEAALRVEGLPPLARELIQAALAIEIAEDAAARQAEQRRSQIHGHTRSAAGRIELMLTGRDA
jgi:hypothetical protein